MPISRVQQCNGYPDMKWTWPSYLADVCIRWSSFISGVAIYYRYLFEIVKTSQSWATFLNLAPMHSRLLGINRYCIRTHTSMVHKSHIIYYIYTHYSSTICKGIVEWLLFFLRLRFVFGVQGYLYSLSSGCWTWELWSLCRSSQGLRWASSHHNRWNQDFWQG